jgi:hypothetical protein
MEAAGRSVKPLERGTHAARHLDGGPASGLTASGMEAARSPGSEKAAITVRPRPGALRRAGAAGRDYQQLWFTLARKQWRSLVLVPADEGGSAAAIAASLAEVGRRLRQTPVTFLIMADPLDFESAGKVIAALDLTRQGGEPLAVATTGKVIVAIQPVVVEPLGLAVTGAADAVVLCVDLGRTRLAAARRTIELVGRERIAGSVLVG